MTERAHVIVVSGLSGAGKSTALNALEDLGYFCVDNLPTSLAQHAVEVCEAGGIHRIGLGIDVRVGSFLDGAIDALDHIAGGARDVVVMFLDATDEALLHRFSETRRPHPLSASASSKGAVGAVAVLDGIQLERERLAPLRARATLPVDTTTFSVHDLRRHVIGLLGPGKAEQPRMQTRVVSFGYKFGLPADADLVFDVRFLENPFFVPALRPLPGSHPDVVAFLLRNEEVRAFIDKAADILTFCLPRYEREGKSYLTIAFGCTGGRHRSVAIAMLVTNALRERTSLPLTLVHRDVARTDIIGGKAGAPSARAALVEDVGMPAEGAPSDEEDGGAKA